MGKLGMDREEYVYLVTNPAWPGWVKVGRTENPKSRLSVFQVAAPFRDYEMIFTAKVAKGGLVEDRVMACLGLDATTFQIRKDFLDETGASSFKEALRVAKPDTMQKMISNRRKASEWRLRSPEEAKAIAEIVVRWCNDQSDLGSDNERLSFWFFVEEQESASWKQTVAR